MLNERLKSFQNAMHGLVSAIRTEANLRFHLTMAMIVILLGFSFEITAVEWSLLCFSIGLVISMELMNTAIERTCDAITLDHNDMIKSAKDIAAAGVLLSSIAVLIVGIIIFLPRLITLF